MAIYTTALAALAALVSAALAALVSPHRVVDSRNSLATE